MFTVYKASDLVKKQFSYQWAVDNLIPDFGISIIYAHPKIGKSLLSIQLSHALTMGKPFLDCRVNTRKKVLYVQVDEPIREWAKQIDLTGLSESWDTLHEEIGLLNNTQKVKELTLLCTQYDFIIMDSLLSLSGYADLSSNVVSGIYLERLKRLTDKPIWLIHHKRKGSPGIPDRKVDSASFSFALTAGASALYDLSASSDGQSGTLQAVGRIVKRDINLQRVKNSLLWTVDYSNILL